MEIIVKTEMLIPKEDRDKITKQLEAIKGVTLVRVTHHTIYVLMPIITTNEPVAELITDLAALESYYRSGSYFVPDHIKTTISPLDFDMEKVFHNDRWRIECNASARWLVKLAQKNGSWRNFTKKEINAIYGAGDGDFWFNELTPNLIKENGNNTYSFTDEFITICYNCRRT